LKQHGVEKVIRDLDGAIAWDDIIKRIAQAA
jgi:hypothetical protein